MCKEHGLYGRPGGQISPETIKYPGDLKCSVLSSELLCFNSQKNQRNKEPCRERKPRSRLVWGAWNTLARRHDGVIKWKHYWSFVRGIHRSQANSLHKGQWRGALMFSLICAWINVWVNNGEAGDLRRHRAHYDVIVMWNRQAPKCYQLFLVSCSTYPENFMKIRLLRGGNRIIWSRGVSKTIMSS